jgi:hypothetical protein
VTGPEPPTSLDELAEAIARLSHEFYNRSAAANGWEPQKSTLVGFDQLPDASRRTTIATFRGLLEADVIQPGPTVTATFRGGDA